MLLQEQEIFNTKIFIYLHINLEKHEIPDTHKGIRREQT